MYLLSSFFYFGEWFTKRLFQKFERPSARRSYISYALCYIVAEALHALMEKVKHNNLIKGFAVENANTEVTHLQFADDTIMLCEASLDQLQNLKCILKWFEFLLGLKINYGKFELTGIQTEESHVAFLAHVFGCKVGKLPAKYLGLPLCLGLPKKHLWDPVVERIEKKLSSWKVDICLWAVVLL